MEKPFINHIFIDLRGRDFKGPNCWFVSPRGASRDAGTDVNTSPLRFLSALLAKLASEIESSSSPSRTP